MRCGACFYFADSKCYLNPPLVIVMPIRDLPQYGRDVIDYEAWSVRPDVCKKEKSCSYFSIRIKEKECQRKATNSEISK